MHNWRFQIVVLLSIFLLSYSAVLPSSTEAETKSPADAASTRECIREACFARRISFEQGESLGLRGVALFEYFFFDIYAIALYASPQVAPSKDILDPTVSKALVVQYFRPISSAALEESTEEALADNPPTDLAELRPQFASLYAAYENILEGDRLELKYRPEMGTSLFHNGRRLITIKGAGFQRAYFGIWLSRDSMDKDLTQKLLGIKS